MKTIRTILITLVIVVVLGVVAVWFLLTNLDTIVEASIEKYGSQVTQTEVGVSDVKIKLMEGEGAISGLTVSNPPGFTASNIFSLGNINTKIDVQTITQDPVVIDEIFVGAPKVVYEINKDGKSNLDILRANIAGADNTEPSTPPEVEKGTEGPRLIIRRLIVEEGQIDTVISALPKGNLSATLPRIELKDIGDKQRGSTADELAEKIVAVLVKKIGAAVTKIDVEKYLGKSVGQLKQDVTGELGKVEKELGKQLDGLRDRLSK